MDNDVKNYVSLLLAICTVLSVLLILYCLHLYNYIFTDGIAVVFMQFVGKSFKLFRVAFVIIGIGACFLAPNMKLRRYITENKRLFFVVFSVCISILLLFGLSGYKFYDIIIYPLLLILHLPFAYLSAVAIKSRHNFKEENIFGVSSKESNFKYELITVDDHKLTVHIPQQNMWIDGGPGSGKSDSIIKPTIKQTVQSGHPCMIYDWEGDPTAGEPLLTTVAYNELYQAKLTNPNNKLRFAFINFTDMRLTLRVNVLSERYFRQSAQKLFIRNISINLMKNLEPAWKEKTDFWANNAINYVYSISYKLFKERKIKCNTMAHTIAMALQNCNDVFRWLESDKEISMDMASMLTAWQEGAQQQTAGAVSSAQLPLVLLNDPNIFWVLSPTEEEEFDLDITNKEHPVCLCIGNAPLIKEAVSPAIACIISVIMQQMNQPNKCESAFIVDELPTINIFGLNTFITTARKHKVATVLAVQDHEQAIKDYGKEHANIIRSACGNQFFGMTGNENTASMIEKIFGEVEVSKVSYTDNDSGTGGSRTESQQKEKVLKIRDVMGQPVGNFVGKIANGEPPFFNVRFKPYEFLSEKKSLPLLMDIEIDTGDAETNAIIFDKTIQANYDRIINEVKEILSPFKVK